MSSCEFCSISSRREWFPKMLEFRRLMLAVFFNSVLFLFVEIDLLPFTATFLVSFVLGLEVSVESNARLCRLCLFASFRLLGVLLFN